MISLTERHSMIGFKLNHYTYSITKITATDPMHDGLHEYVYEVPGGGGCYLKPLHLGIDFFDSKADAKGHALFVVQEKIEIAYKSIDKLKLDEKLIRSL